MCFKFINLTLDCFQLGPNFEDNEWGLLKTNRTYDELIPFLKI